VDALDAFEAEDITWVKGGRVGGECMGGVVEGVCGDVRDPVERFQFVGGFEFGVEHAVAEVEGGVEDGLGGGVRGSVIGGGEVGERDGGTSGCWDDRP